MKEAVEVCEGEREEEGRKKGLRVRSVEGAERYRDKEKDERG